ncbi:MAG: hypothetical protein ABI905_09045 [Betaproteobacteria bacterium]
MSVEPIVLARVEWTERPLAERREILISRIHAERGRTAELAHRLATDVRKTGRAQTYIQTGFTLLKSALVAAGVVWSFRATSHAGAGRRFFTMAVSVLSALRTLRALGKVGAFLSPFSTPPQK